MTQQQSSGASQATLQASGLLQSDLLGVLASPASPAAVVSDEKDRVVLWNRAAAQLLGRSAGESLGRPCFEVLDGRSTAGQRICLSDCPIKAAVAAGEPVAGFTIDVRCGGGARRRGHATILGVRGHEPGSFLVVHLLDPLPVPQNEAPSVPAARLTAREHQVLQTMAAGLQNKEIARALGISPATVRNHVHSILEKLGVRSKLEAVSLAFRSGWIGGPVEARGI
jgi:DNA-binding CsgD family transcriptional regulator